MADWLSSLSLWVAIPLVIGYIGFWLYSETEDEREKEKKAKIQESRCPKCGSNSFYFQPIPGEVVSIDKKVKFCNTCNVEFLPRVKY